ARQHYALRLQSSGSCRRVAPHNSKSSPWVVKAGVKGSGFVAYTEPRAPEIQPATKDARLRAVQRDTYDCQTLRNELQLSHEWTMDRGRRNSSGPWTARTSTVSW